jgi:hypothetical protein
MKMNNVCEFGCECDSPVFKNFEAVLDPMDLDRLIQDKIARARRYIELQENIGKKVQAD